MSVQIEISQDGNCDVVVSEHENYMATTMIYIEPVRLQDMSPGEKMNTAVTEMFARHVERTEKDAKGQTSVAVSHTDSRGEIVVMHLGEGTPGERNPETGAASSHFQVTTKRLWPGGSIAFTITGRESVMVIEVPSDNGACAPIERVRSPELVS